MTQATERLDPAVPASLVQLLERRSVAKLAAPGPTDDQLALILRAATTVPDHGSLHPWRFVVVRGDARESFGAALAQASVEALGPEPAGRLEKLRAKAFVAPTLVVLIAVTKDSPKVPAREQLLSASCTGYAIALAADALGIGAVWKSASHMAGSLMTSTLALRPGEQVLGWVNVGQRVRDEEPEHPRASLVEVVTELGADAVLRPYGAP